ncbi:hypothetical protein V6N11_044937 [Hibiscus sabdariffa]|uniref:Uncharacterized protein n=1 Tax=Hibiscus sabdariffa TaxID=183260 RepID=A0ABR2PUB0_9ROSI
MDKVNEEHVPELLEAHAQVWNHMFSFVRSMSLKCAIDLGIPDIVQNHGKPMTVTELVAVLPTLNPTKACHIHRLMRILVHSGFFACRKLDNDAQQVGYVLTNASRLLLKNNPLSVTPFLKVVLDPIFMKPWQVLGTWFQNDDSTPFFTGNGKTMYGYCGHDPWVNNLFNEAMASDARLITKVLVDKCKGAFEGLESLVDVGGGTGTVVKAIADAFPHLDCTVLDLPHVVDGLQGSSNLKYVGGNMFEAVPAADAVILKWIFHNWNDEECVTILKRCKEAISEGGKVMIVDIVVMDAEKVNEENSKTFETQLFMDVQMMALLTGRERREEEWDKLFCAAGFSDYKIIPILGDVDSELELPPPPPLDRTAPARAARAHRPDPSRPARANRGGRPPRR